MIPAAWRGARPAAEICDGDIYASYSADRICGSRPIRKPFTHDGSLWTCIGIVGSRLTGSGQQEFHAYRLISQEAFGAAPTSYHDKVNRDCGETARKDPNGFYHGMAVKHGQIFVLCGPPAVFVAIQEPARPATKPGPGAVRSVLNHRLRRPQLIRVSQSFATLSVLAPSPASLHVTAPWQGEGTLAAAACCQ